MNTVCTELKITHARKATFLLWPCRGSGGHAGTRNVTTGKLLVNKGPCPPCYDNLPCPPCNVPLCGCSAIAQLRGAAAPGGVHNACRDTPAVVHHYTALLRHEVVLSPSTRTGVRNQACNTPAVVHHHKRGGVAHTNTHCSSS
eukprot:356850-Chlamydomonas_euryale.AAC.2